MAGKANSLQEFEVLVREALNELDDLRASIEYDEESVGGAARSKWGGVRDHPGRSYGRGPPD